MPPGARQCPKLRLHKFKVENFLIDLLRLTSLTFRRKTITIYMHSDVQQTSRMLTVQVHPSLVYHRGGFTAASSERPVDSMPPRDSASGLVCMCHRGRRAPQATRRPQKSRRGEQDQSCWKLLPHPPGETPELQGTAWAHLRVCQKNTCACETFPALTF